jgi:hypothetical protein
MAGVVNAKADLPIYGSICGDESDSSSDEDPEVNVTIKKKTPTLTTEMVTVGYDGSDDEGSGAPPIALSKSKQKSFPETKRNKLTTAASAIPRSESSSSICLSVQTTNQHVEKAEAPKYATPPTAARHTGHASTGTPSSVSHVATPQSGQSSKSAGIALGSGSSPATPQSLSHVTPTRTTVKIDSSKDRLGGSGGYPRNPSNRTAASSLNHPQINDDTENSLSSFEPSPPQRGYPTSSSSVHSHGSASRPGGNGVQGYGMSLYGSGQPGGASSGRRAALSRPVSGTTL